jgi:uncharacterized damage-inducible protein DinB
MTVAESLMAEFQVQVPVTRRFLERLPEDKLTWKPHERSMSAGQLALHIARVPGAIVGAAQRDSIPPPDFGNIPHPSSLREILATFDESVATVRQVLPQFDDASMQKTWRIVQGEKEVAAMPRVELLRNIMLNHWYQHRGQFSVYLRLLNVAVPASWGPSADEQPNFPQRQQTS